jgi:hypothetical protein
MEGRPGGSADLEWDGRDAAAHRINAHPFTSASRESAGNTWKIFSGAVVLDTMLAGGSGRQFRSDGAPERCHRTVRQANPN